MNVRWMIERGGGRKDILPSGGAEEGVREGWEGRVERGGIDRVTGDGERLSSSDVFRW